MSRKGSSTTTRQETTQIFTDQSASAAEGGIAVGAGATVDITSLDREVAEKALEKTAETAGIAIAGQVEAGRTAGAVAVQALDTTGEVSKTAIGAQERTAQTSIAAQNVLAKEALDVTGSLAGATIETVKGLAELSSRERQDVLSTTNLALQSQQGVTDKLAALASGALERTQTPDSAVTKQLLWVVGVLAAVFGLVSLLGGRRHA